MIPTTDNTKMITGQELAAQLGISKTDIGTLVVRHVLRPVGRRGEEFLFLRSATLTPGRATKGPSLAEQAAQVGVQIQKEVVTSVDRLRQFRRRSVIAGLSLGVGGGFATVVIAAFFILSPGATTRFFGLYYQANPRASLAPASSHTLGAATDTSASATLDDRDTSLFADMLKPLANASLLVVKVADNQTYRQISDSLPVAAIPGPAGNPGLAGVDGTNGVDGAPGLAGPAGLTGVQGVSGIDGLDGTNGVDGIDGQDGAEGTNGTSVADVMTSSGDLVIRDGTNTTARLGIGTAGQVLSVIGGLPSWQDANWLLAESDTLDSVTQRGATANTLITLNSGLTLTTGPLTLPANAIAISALSAGDFSSKITSGTYSINISGTAASATTALAFTGSLNGDVAGTQTATVVAAINGATLGATTPTAGNLLIGNGSAWTTQALSGDATLSASGLFSLKNSGTPGTYGSASVVPVITTDAQGRVTNVTATTIGGLGSSNFTSANVSQWTNNAGYITASSADTFSNKTISGVTNTLTDIGNGSLANSAITVGTSGPLSGGGSVSLGGLGLTLSCPTCVTTGGNLFTAAATSGANSTITQGGTLTVAAGSNVTTTNNGTGTITIATSANPSFTTVNGLSIANNGSNTLSIANGKTLTVNNSLTLSGTDGTSFVLPAASDDLVGRTAVQTLTNKTLSAPAINGVVTTSGLTLPGFTLAGSITGSGSPNLSGLGTVNGLTFTPQSDGFTIAGGTTSRTLTVTGANITVGSTITPTSAGALTLQSNGANALTLDTGGSATLNIGTANAATLSIGRSGVTTTLNGVANANNLQIGGGTTILKHLSATTTFNAAAIAAGCADMATVAVTGANPGDTVVATPTPVSGGAETLALSWMAYVSSTDTVAIRGCAIGILVNPPNQTWRVDVWQH